MDKTELYAKMSNCPEIQKEWKPKEGDFFSFCGEFKIIKDYEIWALEKRELSDIEEWNEVIKTMGSHFVDHYYEARECFIFLPKQDQIQWMIDDDPMYKKGKRWCTIPRKFTNRLAEFADSGDYNVVAESMEQLWLCFYMWEKHSMKWSGKEWIKYDK